MSARHLTVSVEDRDRRVEPLAEWFAFMWPDGGYPASDHGAPTLPSPRGGGEFWAAGGGGRLRRISLPDGLVADADAGDVGDGVMGPGGKKCHRDPEVASSASGLWGSRPPPSLVFAASASAVRCLG